MICSNINFEFLRNTFREYYYKHSNCLSVPDPIGGREFGFMYFDNFMVRHISFKNFGELIVQLIKNPPSDVFCSNACYRFPSNPIQEKQWQGADLIFDIDIKDLSVSCMSNHSFYMCNMCGNCTPKNHVCTNCSNEKTLHTYIPCNKCFDEIKRETSKLIEFLNLDIGIERRNIEVFFSGNAGYHIYIINSSYNKLDSKARSDIVDYIMGNGIALESMGINKFKNEFFIKFPKGGLSLGWRKRLCIELGISERSVIKMKNLVINKGGYQGFKKEIDTLSKKLGVRIDPHVTTDVHRIFRLAGSINSKSGLSKIRCNNLESFNPLVDSCLLNEKEVNIKLKTNLKLCLKGNNFKLNNSFERLPTYVATYLICKGLADIVL
ncbi:MAG TPA: DNA primase small subunit domain-containing protein [Nitrososphaeraceae archaeon]